MKIYTKLFELDIISKRRSGIRPAEVCADVGRIAQEIFNWLGIRGEDIPKWYEKMAEYSRKQWRKEREKIQAQAIETDEES